MEGNSLMNDKFLWGFLFSQNRPQNERVLHALQSSICKSSNPVSLLLLKKNIDKLDELEAERDAARKQAEELGKQLDVYSRVKKALFTTISKLTARALVSDKTAMLMSHASITADEIAAVSSVARKMLLSLKTELPESEYEIIKKWVADTLKEATGDLQSEAIRAMIDAFAARISAEDAAAASAPEEAAASTEGSSEG